jgi:hypothetical protein
MGALLAGVPVDMMLTCLSSVGINPADVDMVSNVSTTFTSIEAKCELGGDAGDWSIEAVEWSHASSASPGTDDNMIVSFRNLNLITRCSVV